MWEGIKQFASGLWSLLKGIGKIIKGIFTFSWTDMKEGLGDLASGFKDVVGGAIQSTPIGNAILNPKQHAQALKTGWNEEYENKKQQIQKAGFNDKLVDLKNNDKYQIEDYINKQKEKKDKLAMAGFADVFKNDDIQKMTVKQVDDYIANHQQATEDTKTPQGKNNVDNTNIDATVEKAGSGKSITININGGLVTKMENVIESQNGQIEPKEIRKQFGELFTSFLRDVETSYN